MQQAAPVGLKSARDVEALWVFIVVCYSAPFFPTTYSHPLLISLQMPQHTETTFSYDIDTISKQVIQPISCNWSGCTATINSWVILQKVCELLAFPN